MSPEENRVIELKYRSKQIGKMDFQELKAWSKALLLKVHVITGWTIPADELLTVLLDQFEKKLAEDYPNMNPDEIEYAFRSKGTVVEDWGKTMNLNLLDKILKPYLHERSYASQTEEKLRALPKLLPASEVSDDEFIQAVYLLYKQNNSYKNIPVLAYKILEEKMNLSKADKDRIFQYINETTKEGSRKDLCKQKAVAEYFDKL
jgi:hypothetical protein